MDQNKILNDAIKKTKELFNEEKTGHGIDHTRRVYYLANKLRDASQEVNVDFFIVSLSCLRHDWDDVKLFKEDVPYKHAKEFLKQENIPDSAQNQILEIIQSVSFKGTDSVKPKTIEGRFVQDADRLDALGAIGIARAFQYGGAKGRKLYDANEIIPTHLNEQDYRNNTYSTIAHFYQKLFQLKEMRNTQAGKKEAERRSKFREDFLKEREEEVSSSLYKELI